MLYEVITRNRETSLEDVLLEWEASIGRLGDTLDTPVHFDYGEADAIDAVLESTTRIQMRETALALAAREQCPPGDRNGYLTALLRDARQAAADPGYGVATRELFEGLADLAEEAAGLSFTVPRNNFV